jgi:BASS family bile acid:Na+ symporter
MSEVLIALSQLSVLVFVIASMFSLGLSLTMKQIIDPLRNARMVILALVANFIIVPILAYALALLFNLDDSLRTGLILLSTAAGAPFLPKLVDVAKGNIAFSVGLMVLLMVVTIIYLPLVLPLLLGDVQVNPWDIAQSLIIMMLIPLAVGLFIKARYEEAADKIQPTFGMASNIALLVLVVLGLVLNFSSMIALVGTFGILAGILFVLISVLVGYFMGGSDPGDKSVMGLGTAQRNVSAALVVAGQNFGADVLTYVLVMAIISLVLLMPAAGELGKRMKGTAEAAQPSS